MSQKKDNASLSFTATEALSCYRRVKLTTGSGTAVEYADQSDSSSYIGVTTIDAAITTQVTVELTKKGGTFLCEAADTFSAGATLYAADDGKVSDTSSGNVIGTALEAATAAGDIVEVFLYDSVSTATVPRTSFVEDALQSYAIDLTSVKATDSNAILGASAGTPAGAFGVTVGAHGTASPVIIGEAASGNSKTDKLRFQFPLPIEYVSAGDVKVVVHAKVGTLLTASNTLDCECYEVNKEAGIGSDICATAAQTLTASYANYTFTITATSLVAGDILDIELTGVADDTGGTVNDKIYIGGILVQCDVKG